MKKIYKLAAIAAVAGLALASCKKEEKTPDVTPIDPDVETTTWDEIVDINVDYDYSLGYTGIALDFADYKTDKGNYIWEVFGLSSEADFIAALGSNDISASAPEQGSDATIKYGAIDGSTEYLNETTSTTNGWGHWFSSVGDVVSWGDNSAFFTEGYFVENQSLEVTLGSKPDIITASNVGTSYSIIECFYDDDNTVAVRVNAKVVAPEVHTLKVVGEETQTYNVEADEEFAHYPIDVTKAISTLGLADANVKVYEVEPDGTYSVTAAQNFWYATDGTLAAWGDEDLGIDINYGEVTDDAENPIWAWCMYPGVAGTTVTAKVAFYNDNYDAYIITVEANIAEAVPVVLERSVNLTVNTSTSGWREGFITGVEAELEAAFGLSADELAEANANGEIVTWGDGQKFALCDSDTESYDYWDWGAGLYVGGYYNCGEYTDGESFAIAYGKYPGSCAAGQSWDVDYPVTYTPAEVTFVYHVHIDTYDPSASYTIELSIDSSDMNLWRQGFVTTYDETLAAAFGMTVTDVEAADLAGQINPQSVDENGSNDSWYDKDGVAVGWTDSCVIYLGPYHDVAYAADGHNLSLAYGKFPGRCQAGYDVNIDYPVTYTPAEGDAQTVTFHFHIVTY